MPGFHGGGTQTIPTDLATGIIEVGAPGFWMMRCSTIERRRWHG
ncbi:hypothetical protein [Sphingomonas faeni]|nr:hypothetical protein [Sphingomonas faeni]MDQ0836605.1 hypothetical protein [Sphingomonas faeni]